MSSQTIAISKGTSPLRRLIRCRRRGSQSHHRTKPNQTDLLENGTYPHVDYILDFPPDGDADSSSAAPREEVSRAEKRQREETLDNASFLKPIDELTTPAAVASTNELTD